MTINLGDLEKIARGMVAKGKGLLAADESSGTIKKRFETIKLDSTEEHRRTYRDMLLTAPGAQEWVSGVILYDETIRQKTWPVSLARPSPRAWMACVSGCRSITSSARASPSGAP
jgi:fructose-bisphosphate aldolase class 1